MNKIVVKQNTNLQKWLWFVLLGTIATVCFIKIFYCSTSLQGDIYHCMVADYWNFGKGILNGQQLYTDLMDHKGAYLYWIYSLFAIFSNGNIKYFVFFETILFAITIASFTWFVWKITNHKTKSLAFGLIFSLFYFFITQNSILVNVEGMLVPFYFWMYYTVIKKEEQKRKDFFLIGIILGFFIVIKYSSILYFATLFLFFTFSYFIKKKNKIYYWQLIASGMVGLTLSILPFATYLICTNTIDSYFLLMEIASFSKISRIVTFSTISILLLAYALYLFQKENNDYEMWLCLSIFSLSFVGTIVSNHYICLLFSMLITCFFNNIVFQKTKVLYIVFVLFYFGLIFSFDSAGEEYSSVYLTNKYQLNNSNVLYFTEDMEYGIYSDELFQEPYQWIPARMVSNTNFYNKMYALNKQRIEEQRFEYVVGFNEAYVTKENIEYFKTYPPYLLWLDLQPIVEQYYTQISDEALLQETTLWVVKP